MRYIQVVNIIQTILSILIHLKFQFMCLWGKGKNVGFMHAREVWAIFFGKYVGKSKNRGKKGINRHAIYLSCRYTGNFVNFNPFAIRFICLRGKETNAGRVCARFGQFLLANMWKRVRAKGNETDM